MKKSLTITGALLALAAFASTADARMIGGGGGMSMSPSMSHGAPMSSSMGSPRGFSPDGRTTRVKGSNWKHPIDSDGGGPADPPNKPPKGHVEYNSNGGGWEHRPGGHQGQGWWDRWGHHHGPYPSDGRSASSSEPAPASRTPR